MPPASFKNAAFRTRRAALKCQKSSSAPSCSRCAGIGALLSQTAALPTFGPTTLSNQGGQPPLCTRGCCRDATGPGPRFHLVSPRCRPAPPRSPRCSASQGKALPGTGRASEQLVYVKTARSETSTNTSHNTRCARPARPHPGSGLAARSCLRQVFELNVAADTIAVRAALRSMPGSNRTTSDLSLKSVAACPGAHFT